MNFLCKLFWFLHCATAAPLPALSPDVFVGPTVAAATCTVMPDGTGNFTFSPGCTAADLFRDAPVGDFHLVEGSPAIGRAECLAQVPVDFDGNPRPTPGRPPGEGCDIGAFQYQGPVEPIAPPSNLKLLEVRP